MKLDRSNHKVTMPIEDYELVINSNFDKDIYDKALQVFIGIMGSSNINAEAINREFKSSGLKIEFFVKQNMGGGQPEVIIKTLERL